MSRYKLHISHYVIAISGFARDQPVWSRQQLKVHKGPTIELTIAFPQDPPNRFNIPFPVTRDMLRKLVGRHGGVLWPKQLKLLHDRIDEFASDVFDHHSWYRPYRTFPEEFEDCVALARPVTAMGSVGATDAEEYVRNWFR
jgi:hypothetical protein